MSPRAHYRVRIIGLALPLFIYSAVGFLKSLPVISLAIQMGLLILLAGGWLWRLVRRRGLASTPLNLPLVAYLAALGVAVLCSTDPRTSLDALLTVGALVVFYFLFCDLLLAGWSPRVFVDVLLVVVGLFLIEALLFLAIWYLRWLALRVSAYPVFLIAPQLYGVADHPNLLAGLINLALPFAILRLSAAAASRPRGVARPARSAGRRAWQAYIRHVYGGVLRWGGWLLAATVVLFYTTSRAGWLAALTVIGVVVLWLLAPNGLPTRTRWRAWWRGSRGLWLALAAYLLVFALLAAANTRASTSEYTANAGGASAGRGVLWQVAWDSFTARPLTGTGPLTYTRQYTDRMPFERANSYTPNHAHNLLLNTLAQEGLLGGLTLVWLVGTGLWVCGRGWMGLLRPVSDRAAAQDSGSVEDRPQRTACPLFVGATAGLAGFLVHSCLDVISWLPSIALIAVLLAALAMHEAGQVRPGVYSVGYARAGVALVVLAFVILPFAFARDYTARTALLRAIRAAGNGEWMAATDWMQQAVTADPTNLHYLRQRAYVYGVRAAPQAGPGDPLALTAALKAYDELLAVQDSWVPDLLNAGILNQMAGDTQRAQQLFEAAAPRWRGWPLPALLLGDSYARHGHEAEAWRIFTEALAHNARAADTLACLQNRLCQLQAEELPQPDGSIGQIHQQARTLLDAGESVQALAALQAVPISTRSALIWIDRAEGHIALGQVREGRYALEVAATLEGTSSPDTAARLAMLRAALLTLEGRRGEAIAALEGALRPRIVLLPYDLIHRQFSMPGMFVPRLAMLERTEDDLEAYYRLGQLYRLEGREEDGLWADRNAAAVAASMARAVSVAGKE